MKRRRSPSSARNTAAAVSCGIPPPLRHLRGDQVVQPGNALLRLVDGEQAFLHNRFERGQRQYEFAQETLVRVAPVGFAGVAVYLTQEERL